MSANSYALYTCSFNDRILYKKMNKLHFSVDGEFITKFARDRYMETNDKNVAIALLCKSLNGMPRDIAEDIVLGKKKLVGVNEVYLEDDDTLVRPYGYPTPMGIERCLCGWVSPEGNVYGCEVYTQTVEHLNIARDLVRFGVVSDTRVLYERVVEEAGYVKFSPELIVANCASSMITDKQHSEIIRFLHSHKITSIQMGYDRERVMTTKVAQMDTMMFAKTISN